MACCMGHRENSFFDKLVIISLAPKLCEMYATILLSKLFLNYPQYIIEEVNATVRFILLLVNS